MKKANSSGVAHFVYDDAGHLLGEYDAAGALVQELIWFGDIPVATIRTDQSGGSVGVFYIHTDHLNAPAKITRPADNQVIWRWDHDPFGNGVPNEDPDGNGLVLAFNLRLPGQYFDSETGNHYNYFRNYDPSTGRYLESDPIGLRGGINTYVYVRGNPVGSIDPLGLLNPTKTISSFANAANAGRLYAGGALKLGAAAGLEGTGVGIPVGLGAAAIGVWNLKSAGVAWDRSRQLWIEAMNEEWSDASWKNLLGILPFGTEFDDPCEPSPLEVFKKKFEKFMEKPKEILFELGTMSP